MNYAAQSLSEKYSCTFNGSDIYDYAVLPLQKSRDGITIPDTDIEYTAIGRLLKEGGTVFTGSVCPELERVCYGYGFTLINYLEQEELAVANAVPTAEAALEIAISRLPVTVFSCNTLITGYGRIAKILAKYLCALGAKVTVACRRKSDLRWAEINGCSTTDITDETAFKNACATSQVIFNTVPFTVFTENIISSVKEETLYIELASTDGIDIGKAADHGIKAVTARGLPGKTAPVTAGMIIARTIENILAERSDSLES